jgi:predicted ATP-grasp superfamily ATP-dependent carboligase
MNDLPTAVVVSGLAPGLAVVRSLGRRGVKVLVATHNPEEPAARSRYAAGVLLTPKPAVNEDGLAEALLDGLPTDERPVIIPSEDAAVTAVARNLDRLTDRFAVAAPSWSVAEWFIDKRKTALLAKRIGVRAPQSLMPKSLDHAAAIGESLAYPVLVKPSQGHIFSRQTGLKMIAVEDRPALLRAVRVCSENGVEPVVQEIVPGPPENGANQIVYMRGGEMVADFTARKIRNWPVDWGSPCALVSERIDGLTDRTCGLLEASGYEGMACAEYKYDARCDDYQLMEVNIRHNLSGALAPHCGIDFPWIDYSVHAGLDVDSGTRGAGFEEGVHWVDGFRDAANLAKTGTWWRDPGNARAPYGGLGARAFFDRDDMAPFWSRAARLGRKATRRARTRVGLG